MFEGHYHYGVAALINSLYANGFRGDFFAGYKGDLPGWAINLSAHFDTHWTGAKTMQVANDLNVHFLPLTTQWHLTNYKPEFMQDIRNKFPEQVKNILYFDPDIVVKAPWRFFERWITHGVALVHEAVSVIMPPTHPVRKEWEKVIVKSGYTVQRRLYSGINGGFCGVAERNLQFLKVWSDIINSAIKFYGINPLQFGQKEDVYVFHMADQDALNMAAMCCECPISEMGPDAMDFMPGGWRTMSHATGSPKPWKKKYIMSALKGIRPTLADKSYWLNNQQPVTVHGKPEIKLKRFSLSVASLIGRFYGRS